MAKANALSLRPDPGGAPVALEIARRSHPGQVRTKNEDSVRTAPAIGLALLADGLGGYSAGEVASDMATSLLHRTLTNDLSGSQIGKTLRVDDLHNLLRRRIAEVNEAIHRRATSRPELAGMATTLVLVLFSGRYITFAHVGDSRLYRLRGTELTRITRDHSLLQEQIDAGILRPDDAPFFPERNLVTRALGAEAEVIVDIAGHEVMPGDLYLMCSDGLTEMLSDAEIRAALIEDRRDLEIAAERLLGRANARGGLDNISLILIGVHEAPAAAPGLIDRLADRFRTRVRAWQS